MGGGGRGAPAQSEESTKVEQRRPRLTTAFDHGEALGWGGARGIEAEPRPRAHAKLERTGGAVGQL